MYQFGSGIVYLKPITVAGVTAPNTTPIQIGTLQDSSIDISLTVKELYGRNRFPDDAQTAQGKITGKIKFGRINSKVMLEAMFGAAAALAVGGNILALDEAGAIPGTSTYTITVTNAATFKDDLGVKYTNTGVALTKVAAVTAAGQYSVNTTTGVYTFYSADASGLVKISYTYSTSTASTAIATSTTMANSAMGSSPRCLLYLYNSNAAGQQIGIKLFSVIISKLSIPTKNEDYTVIDSDFTAFADASGNVMEWDAGE